MTQTPGWRGLTDTRLRQYLRDANLAHVADAVIESSQPSIGLHTTARPDDAIPIGSSKTGGCPDLPHAIEWPQWKGRPLSFLAQINLDEVASYAPPAILPTTGQLSFFYDIVDSPWGFDPKDRGGWKVLFTDVSASTLERRSLPPPLTEPDRLWFTSCVLEVSSELTPPSPFAERLARLALEREEEERYSDWWSDLKAAQGAAHRLLGLPYLIQGDIMELECQLASNGVYVGTGQAYGDPRYAQLRAGAQEWQLLLQLDSDETAEMAWGDDGMLYYWIRRHDLLSRDFGNTWLVLQCY